jgi:PPOX class probable F420-dependent enzyme
MLDWAWAVERLEQARNYWICTVRHDGSPHAAPVWGLWHEGAIVFSTSPDSAKGRHLARDPRVLVHLESGDEVVIVEGRVERIPLDEGIAAAYAAKYDFRPEPSVDGLWFRVRPSAGYAWTEQAFPRTATRFRP